MDLLVERGARFVAIECKLAEAPGPEALSGFRSLEGFYGPAVVERAIVACRTHVPYGYAEHPGATAVGVADLPAALARRRPSARRPRP